MFCVHNYHPLSLQDLLINFFGENVFAVSAGRGLFAKGSFCKGDFIVEYRGELINYAELERRRKLYHPSCAVFMFEFKWRGKTWW